MIYTLIKKDSEGNIEKIFSFDSVSAYSETYSGTVSKSPVEFGFDVSDHINVENPVFDLNATLSAYSLFNDSFSLGNMDSFIFFLIFPRNIMSSIDLVKNSGLSP